MTENINKEDDPIKNPQKTELELIPEENITSVESDNITPKPEIEDLIRLW